MQRAPKFGVGNGVILLLVLNYVVFALSQLSNLPLIQRLPLYSANTQWWSFVTYAFCHADFNHLANNMFMLLVFGRSVEEDEVRPFESFLYAFLDAVIVISSD